MAGKEENLILLSVTNDLVYDQRMIRTCQELYDNGFNLRLLGRKKQSSLPVNFDFSSKRIRCIFNRGFLFYAEYNLRLWWYFLRIRPKAICSVDLDTSLASVCCPIKTYRIYDAHEYFTELPEIIHRPIVKWVWERIGKYAVKRFQSRYTVNTSLQDILTEKYGVGFKCIRNVPVLTTNQITRSENEKIILYQGVLNKGRGIEVLMQAVAEMDDVKLHLVGEGDLSNSLRTWVIDNGLENRIVFLGYKSPEELRSYTPKCWIGINVLEGESKNYYYSLANKFFDYMHASVPSICMNFPEYLRINEEHEVSVLINTLDVSSLKEAINYLTNLENYSRLKANCDRAREKYKWQEESKALLAIYKDLR